MAVIINGDTGIDKITDGSVVNADIASGIDAAKLTGTLPALDASSLTGIPAPAALSTASGSAPSYSARAWVNFNGTGAVAIRESGNVSSITDNGTGDYTINFTTAMPDADYSSVFSGSENLTNPANRGVSSNWTSAPSSSAVRIRCVNSTNTATDMLYVHAAIFR